MAAASHRARSWSASRVVEGHECQQAERLALVGHERAEDRRQADGLGAQLPAHQRVPAGRGVALVEDQVHRGEDRGQPVGQRGVARDGEGDARVAQLALGAHDALLHRRLGDQEGAGDLRGLQAADEPQGQPHPRLEGERRVAAGEDQRQAVVGDGHGVVVLLAGHGPLELGGQHRRLVGEALGAPQAVDRLVARRPGDPGGRLVRHAVARPALERDDEGLLDRLLGQVDVPQHASQHRDRPSRAVAEQAVDLERGAAVQEAAVPAASLFSATSVPPASGRTSMAAPQRTAGTFLAQAIASSRSAQSTT
jgi:hypothetical protein